MNGSVDIISAPINVTSTSFQATIAIKDPFEQRVPFVF